MARRIPQADFTATESDGQDSDVLLNLARARKSISRSLTELIDKEDINPDVQVHIDAHWKLYLMIKKLTELLESAVSQKTVH